MSTTASVVCEVEYWVDDDYTNVEVKWYRKTSEHTVSLKYTAVVMPASLSINTTAIVTFILEVPNFNVSDRGNYWCQIVVNNTSLSPSPYGYIYSSDCSLFDVTCTMSPPLCAQNLTAHQLAHTQGIGTCTLENSDNNNNDNNSTITRSGTTTMSWTDINMVKLNVTATITTMTDPVNVMSTSTVFDTDSKDKCNFSRRSYLCSIGVLLGVILVIIVCLLVLSITFFYCRRQRKKGKLDLEIANC